MRHFPLIAATCMLLPMLGICQLISLSGNKVSASCMQLQHMVYYTEHRNQQVTACCETRLDALISSLPVVKSYDACNHLVKHWILHNIQWSVWGASCAVLTCCWSMKGVRNLALAVPQLFTAVVPCATYSSARYSLNSSSAADLWNWKHWHLMLTSSLETIWKQSCWWFASPCVLHYTSSWQLMQLVDTVLQQAHIPANWCMLYNLAQHYIYFPMPLPRVVMPVKPC